MLKNDFLFKINNFSLKMDKTIINNLNAKINNNSLLIFSNNKNISEFLSIFMFKIINKNYYSGDIFYKNTNIIEELKKIKKFNVKDKNIIMLSNIISKIFVIPEKAKDIFDNSLTISDQILDFLTYNTRIRILNSIIRREMISHDDIKNLIEKYNTSDNKDNFLIYWSTEYGVPNILNELNKILKSNENLNEKLMRILLYQKTGVNLADIVILRDYYKSKNGKTNLYKNTENNVDFINIKLKKKSNEKLLKSEVSKHIIEYLKLLEVNDLNILNKKPEEIENPILKELLLAIAIFSDIDILIFDNPGITDESKKFMNNINKMHKIFNFAYICTAYNNNVIKHYYKLFDDIKILYEGNVIEEANMKDFIEDPLHPYSKFILKNDAEQNSYMQNGCNYYSLCKFSMNICKNNIPLEHEVIKNHSVACFIYDNK